MFKPKLNRQEWIFISGVILLLVFIASSAFAETKQLWFEDPRSILNEFKKDYKLEKDSDGWYWFLGKEYKALEEISEEEISKIPATQMLEKTKDGVRFSSFAASGLITPIQQNGEDYTVLRLPGGGSGGEVGKPELPYYGQFITVPKEAEVELVVDGIVIEPIQGEYKVFPVQPPLLDREDAEIPAFTINEEIYKQDKYIGEDKPVSITSDVIVRGKRLIYVTYQPVFYNPAQNKLKAAWKVDWNLKYKYPQKSISQIKEKVWEKEFSGSVGNMVMDGVLESEDQSSQSMQAGQGYKIDVNSNGADYLIIVHDNFYDAVLPLAEWKEKKGYKVRITKLTEIKASGNPTADEITNYISTAYKNWSPVPLYLLLVGDAQFLPPHYKTTHPNIFPARNLTKIATDLYYAAVDGSDIFPDLFIGRLPCATVKECKTMVDKILLMEKEPPAVNSFYSNALIAGYFQDDNKDGIEDRLFLETCEGIKDFLELNNWHVNTSYVAGSTTIPRKYNTASILHPSKDKYINTQTYLLPNAARTTITDVVNSGVCLIQHRDHGGETGWGDPPYFLSDIASLTNGNKLSWVNSINCLTGRFDYSNGDCFAEAWLKKEQGGAYAVIAASKESFSWWNDYLTHGFYECIWQNYMQTLSTFTGYKKTLSYSGNVVGYGSHLGQVLNFAKMFMFHNYANGNQQDDNKIEFELFNLLGCPEQEPRLFLPQTLLVDYPKVLTSSEQVNFDITVTAETQPVEDARVSLLLKPTEFYAGITDAQGKVHFEFTTPDTSGDMLVTVCHKNAFPFEGNLLIIIPPPTTPVVIDQGEFTARKDYLFAKWSSEDKRSGITEYQYAVGKSKGATDIVGWTSRGAATDVSKFGLSLQNGQSYYFSVKAKNNAEVWSEVGYSDGIILDITPPTGTVKINNDNAFSNAAQVTLNLSALDTGVGMGTGSRMQISNDNKTWLYYDYADTKTWSLSSGDGTKTVYVRFQDAVGNKSGLISDSIILDSTAPTITHTPIASASKNTPIGIMAASTDAVSGVKESKVHWRKYRKVWFLWVQIGSGNLAMIAQGNNLYKATLAGQEADRKIKYYIEAKDNAGNILTTPYYEFMVR